MNIRHALFCALLSVGVASAAPIQRTFQWDATVFTPTCSGFGYKIHSGAASRLYDAQKTVGNVLTTTLTVEDTVDTYVAASAFQTCGSTVQESGYSNEVFLAGKVVHPAISPPENPRIVMVVTPPTPINFSMWNDGTAVVLWESDSAVTLGVKFKVTETGHKLTAIRYYKAASSATPSKVGVWNSTGTLIASATAQNETSSGWQTVPLATPLAIVGNQEYTMGYLSNGGYHFLTDFGWPATNGVLTYSAGTYTYGTNLARPVNVWNNTNYWVDGIFE